MTYHHMLEQWNACTQRYAWLDACMHGPVAWSHEATSLDQAASPNGQSKHVRMSFLEGARKACSKARPPTSNPNTVLADQQVESLCV